MSFLCALRPNSVNFFAICDVKKVRENITYMVFSYSDAIEIKVAYFGTRLSLVLLSVQN